MNRYLLDCTLRDGGYLNDWHYGTEKMKEIFSYLVKAKMDYIEVGFLDERRPLDLERSINPTIEAYEEIYKGVDKGHSKVMTMIDFGTRSLDGIKDHKEGDFVDGIRVIFKKEKKEKALPYCAALKKKGYIVFAQMVSITAYEEKDLEEFVALIKEAMPNAVSIVDTYGLLDNIELDHYDDYLDSHLPSGIALGLHTHNNLELAFANAAHFLDKEHSHDILADGTLFGHGKSAGNAPTELIAHLLDARYGKDYDLGVLLEVIEGIILPMKEKLKWGYQYDFMIASANRVHPNYISYLRKKGCNGAKIYELTKKLTGPETLLYSEEAIKKIYEEEVKD